MSPPSQPSCGCRTAEENEFMSKLWTPTLSALPMLALHIADDPSTLDMMALQEAMLSSPRVFSVRDSNNPTSTIAITSTHAQYTHARTRTHTRTHTHTHTHARARARVRARAFVHVLDTHNRFLAKHIRSYCGLQFFCSHTRAHAHLHDHHQRAG
jgi:hypothetical protein